MSNGFGGVGGGGKSGGVTGGAKKVVGIVLAVFVLMAVLPNMDALMSAAESLGDTVVSIFDGLGTLADKITQSFDDAASKG